MIQSKKEEFCGNSYDVKVLELTERVSKLEKEQKKQDKQDVWSKTMMKIVFYGAVANGIQALAGLITMLSNFFKK